MPFSLILEKDAFNVPPKRMNPESPTYRTNTTGTLDTCLQTVSRDERCLIKLIAETSASRFEVSSFFASDEV